MRRCEDTRQAGEIIRARDGNIAIQHEPAARKAATSKPMTCSSSAIPSIRWLKQAARTAELAARLNH